MAGRVVCSFSCGAASAVAAKLAIADHPDAVIINAYIENEHKDNRRFLADCEKWFGKSVTILRDEKFGADIIQVFRRKRFISSPRGAACSSVLKQELLRAFWQPWDAVVIGYTAEEEGRFEDFVDRWPERKIIAPLIDRGLTKQDCLAMIERAGIELPMMYRLGYDNANCIGCVKGGHGYFRAIREDFPAEFERLAAVEEEVGAKILRHRSGPLSGQRFGLRELPQGVAARNEGVPSCSFFCETAEQEYTA